MYIIAWIGLIFSSLSTIVCTHNMVTENNTEDRLSNLISDVIYLTLLYFFIHYLF